MRVIYAAAVAAVLSVGLGVVSFGGVDRGVSSVHAQEAAPTPTVIINCAPGQPCIDLHGERTEVVLGDGGDLIAFNLSIRNSLVQPEMTVALTLQAPSGWSLSGEGLADECSAQCSAVYKVGSGEQKFVEFTSRPNQVGQFRFQGHLEWFFDGGTEVYGHTETISVSVYSGEGTQRQRPPAPETERAVATGPPNGSSEETETGVEKRGLFLNYVEGSAPFNVLDPTTLAIVGIVLTVLTTWMQLVTGRK